MDIDPFRISAIIPLYNGAPFIEEAIRSVLQQTLMPIEIIVVDDGSTDDSAAIVRQLSSVYPIKLMQKPNGGQSSARNLGVTHSEGNLIAFLDQDDIWYPHHLEELVRPFRESRHKQLGWVYSNVDEIDEKGRMVVRQALAETDATHPKRNLAGCLAHDMFVLPSATLVSREAFEAMEGFDERLSGYEDDDLFLRMFRHGFENIYLTESLSKWRVFRTSSSFSPRMAKSRRTYAQKLLDLYPDEPLSERYYTRDLLVPRFHRQMLDEYRKALLSVHDLSAIREAKDNLEFIRCYLPSVRTKKLPANSHIISAVLTLRNGEDYIEESIRGALDQTLRPAEIIVVDHGSTDGGLKIVEKLARAYPIKLLSNQNGGRSSARNHGVAHCGGDLVAFLDQGDVWKPGHLEELVQPFLEPQLEHLGWVYGNVDVMDEQGTVIQSEFLSRMPAPHPKRHLVDCLLGDMFVFPSASLISRKAFDKVGGFDEHLSGYEEEDLFLKIFRAGFGNFYLNKTLSKWRSHPSRSYPPGSAQDRSIYARKLLSLYPDDAPRGKFYARDFVGPRFFRSTIAQYKHAINGGDQSLIRESADELRFIGGYIRPRHRAFLAVLLGLGSLGKYVLALQPFLRPLYRRLF